MAVGNPISSSDNVASRVISQTATASQTNFNISGGYRLNAISVYRNGIRLASGRDYSAVDGSTVVLLSPATASDTLQFHIFDDFRVADAIVSNASQQNIEGNITIVGNITATTGSFSGDVSIGGTLTYEDVTNIDSVGVITARKDVHVGAGLSVVGVSTFNNTAIFNGNVDLGNASGDTITVAGRFDSDLIPSLDDEKDLGSATVEWRDLYLDGTANIDTLSVSGNSTFTGSVGIGTNNPEEILHILGPTETISSRDGVTLQHSTATTAADNGLPLVWSGYVGSGSGLQNYGLASICGRKENSNADDGAAYLQFGVGRASGAIIERLRITSVGRVGIGTDNPSVSVDLSENTDAVALPTGTTAQRPSGTDAYIRKNSTNNALEFYNGTEWVEIITDYFPTGSTTLG